MDKHFKLFCPYWPCEAAGSSSVLDSWCGSDCHHRRRSSGSLRPGTRPQAAATAPRQEAPQLPGFGQTRSGAPIKRPSVGWRRLQEPARPSTLIALNIWKTVMLTSIPPMSLTFGFLPLHCTAVQLTSAAVESRFPWCGGSDGKEAAGNAGDPGSIPW